MMLRIGVLGLMAMLTTACEHVQDPWTGYAPQWKREQFDTRQPDSQLRHRLRYTQIDR